MNTNTAIKTWQERVAAMPNEKWRVAHILEEGFNVQESAMCAEISDLRTALEAAQQQLASYEAQMLRMAQCAGEFAKDACKAQPDSGRDAALMEAAAACMRATPDRAEVRAIGEAAHYVACRDAVLALRIVQQGEQAPAAKAGPDPLHTAVAAFIKAKGRFHAEQSYKALVAAYDSGHGAKELT